jgi:2-amino-4-hydroxy-6-hydroxymethyldihydropteridine diphosphokinase
METVYLSLGSNIGDRAGNVARAVAALRERGVRVVRESALYETEPVDMRSQEWFVNSVVAVETEDEPRALMAKLLVIERAMGRERLVPKGPRVIDIDIVLYGERVVNEAGLEIPHPRMAERRFVLVPLAEIAEGAVHPVLRKTARELLDETHDKSEVKRAADVRGSITPATFSLPVKIVRFVDDSQPGWVECEFTDVDDRTHTVVDKVPIFTSDRIDANTKLPLHGTVECEIVAKLRDALGNELLKINLERPLGLSSKEGLTEFLVLAAKQH